MNWLQKKETIDQLNNAAAILKLRGGSVPILIQNPSPLALTLCHHMEHGRHLSPEDLSVLVYFIAELLEEA